MESEASQIAELAMAKNKRHAIIITDDSPLSTRLQLAFAERWLAEYEHTAESVKYDDEQTVLGQFRKYTAPNQFVRKSLFAQFDTGKVILLDVQDEKIVD